MLVNSLRLGSDYVLTVEQGSFFDEARVPLAACVARSDSNGPVKEEVPFLHVLL